MSSPNLVLSSVGAVKDSDHEGYKTCTVQLPCPRSFNDRCTYKARTWSCGKCALTLKYGYDKFFYCACGRAPTNTFKFKCGDPRHGDDFEEFPEKDLDYMLARMRTLKEINILVVGETGVGKSTWINGIANYATFATFEDAESNKPVCMIPSMHTVVYKGTKTEVLVGEEADKDQMEQPESTGQSVTQFPASYVFKYHDFAIRLIDTPGIGDTRGLETDKLNLQNVLDHLSHFDELHGICILLPPNQARLTIAFKFCLKELLKQLHRDACKNIVFCFTRSRATDYVPGETVDVLQALFAEMVDVQVELTEKTLYCTDSETVVYLFAVQQGVNFDSSVRETRKTSWETSVSEAGRLLENVLLLKPHQMKNTLSLNATRRVILALCNGPLVDISTSIQTNIEQLKAKEVELKKSMKTTAVETEAVDAKSTLLKIPFADCRLQPLRRPRVICTSPACSTSMRLIDNGGVERLQYDQVCCDACRAPILRLCESFRHGLSRKCKRCSCGIARHTLMTCDVVRTIGTLDDPETERKLRAQKTRAGQKDVVVNKVAELLDDQQSEQCVILDVAATLTIFLETNSVIPPTSDAFVDYLDQQIELERKLAAQRTAKDVGASARTRLENLEKLLADYGVIREQNKKSAQPSALDSENVRRRIDQLYALKLNGQQLKAAVEIVENSSADLAKQADKVFTPDLQRISAPKRNAVQKVLSHGPSAMAHAADTVYAKPQKPPRKPVRC